MKNITKALLATLGATNVVFYIATPILIAILWSNISVSSWGNYVIYSVAIVASIFRSIKVGWMPDE